MAQRDQDNVCTTLLERLVRIEGAAQSAALTATEVKQDVAAVRKDVQVVSQYCIAYELRIRALEREQREKASRGWTLIVLVIGTFINLTLNGVSIAYKAMVNSFTGR